MKPIKTISLFFILLLVSSIGIDSMKRVMGQGDSGIEAGTVAKDSFGFEMVYVPSGEFEMGIQLDALEILNQQLGIDTQLELEEYEFEGILNVYTANLPGFWMDRYEVTIEQYQNYHHLCMVTGKCLDIRDIGLYRPDLTSSSTQPQVGITWHDAMRFCVLRGARLPTEEEWEYAASGPDNYYFPWGNEPNLENVLLESSDKRTYPVGSIPGNASWVGIYDMAGNAAEWVDDYFAPYPGSPEEDYANNTHEYYKVVRGGFYGFHLSQLTTYGRTPIHPEASELVIGFRCARFGDPREGQP